MGVRPEGTRVGQPAEWLTPRLVLLCEPSTETLLGMLGASSSNYLHPFSLAGAQAEHRQFRGALQSIGTKVIDLREALAANSEDDPQARRRLEQWARASTSYDFGDALAENERAEAEAHFTRTVEKLDALDLADLILLRPNGPHAAARRQGRSLAHLTLRTGPAFKRALHARSAHHNPGRVHRWPPLA